MTTFDPNFRPTNVYFIVGQKVVVFNQENQILFLRRSIKTKRAGGWDFPGGGLEDEDPISGIKRETKEEANIEIDEVRPISIGVHGGAQTEKTLLIGYMARLASGEVKLSWEHDEFKWLNVSEALHMDLPEMHKKFLEAAIQSNKVLVHNIAQEEK